MNNDITVVCSFGDPGSTTSAVFSPLDRGDCIDVGKIIGEDTGIIEPPVTHVDSMYLVLNDVPIVLNGIQIIFKES